MKRLIAFALLFVLASCSSAQKKQDSAQAKDSKATAQAKVAAKSSAATEKKPASSGQSQVSCKNGDEVRTIQIMPKGEGCDVVYTKAGQKQTVATAHNSHDYCNTVLHKMEDKLTGSGFSCK